MASLPKALLNITHAHNCFLAVVVLSITSQVLHSMDGSLWYRRERAWTGVKNFQSGMNSQVRGSQTRGGSGDSEPL